MKSVLIPTAALAVLLFVSPARAVEGSGVRALRYPEVTEAAFTPPTVRVASGGAPVTLYFPDETIDQRPPVNFVTSPGALVLSIAERNAYVYAASAKAGDVAMLTLTLSGGRPLAFRLEVVAPTEAPDTAIHVRLHEQKPAVDDTALRTELQRCQDDLSESRETSGARSIEHLASLLANAKGETVERRGIGHRDKQSRIFLEVLDAVRLFDHTYLRIQIENRDGSGKAWVPGEYRINVVGKDGARTPIEVVGHHAAPEVSLGSVAVTVLAVPTPQLSKRERVEVAVFEKDGQRHLLIEDLEL